MSKYICIALLLGLCACNERHPAWLMGTHWTDNLSSNTLQRYSLVCEGDGKIVGSIVQGYAWYAESSDGRLNNEYQNQWQAENALELYVQNKNLCGGGSQ